jgi:radical SAM protein with 4Fe4S-binding SPASM domain
MRLMEAAMQKALQLGVPWSVHVDVTYRCNERCEHCYLDHDDHGEMSTQEICGLLDQMAAAGTMFVVFSGGEVFMRRDFLDLVEHARRRLFNVKVKTNAAMIRTREAQRLRDLGVEQVQISVYSHRPEIHDAITKLPGSLKRTLDAIRFLRSQDLRVTVANVLMRSNYSDHKAVHALALELGATYTLDPTITPMMNGDTSVLNLRIPGEQLPAIFLEPSLVGNVEEFCAPPTPPTDEEMDSFPCSAGHTACYVSPYGEVYPCVQFPISCGNVRQQSFEEIWWNSPQMNQVRGITARDLHTCSSCSHVGGCTRCPGLAFMEGDMRGPSSADCEKSYHRTGIPSANMLRGGNVAAGLVQIQGSLC